MSMVQIHTRRTTGTRYQLICTRWRAANGKRKVLESVLYPEWYDTHMALCGDSFPMMHHTPVTTGSMFHTFRAQLFFSRVLSQRQGGISHSLLRHVLIIGFVTSCGIMPLRFQVYNIIRKLLIRYFMYTNSRVTADHTLRQFSCSPTRLVRFSSSYLRLFLSCTVSSLSSSGRCVFL